MKYNYTSFSIFIFTFIVLLFLFGILFLIKDQKDNDGFTNNNNSRNVDIELTTNYKCSNKCGPPNICSITGEDCLSDKDCKGCTPTKQIPTRPPIPLDSTGKLTFSGEVYPYSKLTHDMGSEALLLSPNKKFTKPPHYNQGVDEWSHIFDVGYELYDNRYNISYNNNIGSDYPKYPERNTLSGDFRDVGPVAANNYL